MLCGAKQSTKVPSDVLPVLFHLQHINSTVFKTNEYMGRIQVMFSMVDTAKSSCCAKRAEEMPSHDLARHGQENGICGLADCVARHTLAHIASNHGDCAPAYGHNDIAMSRNSVVRGTTVVVPCEEVRVIP